MSEPRVADLMVQVALRLGADRRPVSPTALHRTYLKEFPQTRVGRSIEGFAATLGYHCINTRSRFPDPADKRRPADWQRRPLFKRVARGRYMLLSDAEIECFRRCLEQSLAIVYVDTCESRTCPALAYRPTRRPIPAARRRSGGCRR
jgi:hypothetical protein